MLSQKSGAAVLLTASLLHAAQIHLKTRDVETSAENSDYRASARWVNPARKHLLLEFHKPITPELLATLAAREIIVTNVLSDRALAVAVPANLLPEDLEITWVGKLAPKDKLSPELENTAIRQRGWIVQFHKDVAPEVAAEVLERSGLSNVAHPDLRQNDFMVVGNKASLREIAEYDEVAYVFPAPEAMLAGKSMLGCAGAVTIGGPTAQYVKVGSGWAPNSVGGLLLNYIFGHLTNKVPLAQVKSEIARAMRQWAAVTNVQFQLGRNTYDPYTVAIEFGTTLNGDPNPFTSLTTLAHTYYPSPPNPEPIAGDMHFNPDENWHVGTTTDIYTVALHELGHSLGLGHTDNPSDVMYPYYRFGAQLSENDIAGVQSMYGVPNASPPPAPMLSLSVASPTDGSSTANPTANLAGTVANANGNPTVTWQTNTGQSGRATGSASWTAAGVPLAVGVNLITVTVNDNSAKPAARLVRVTRTGGGSDPGGGPANNSVPVITVTSPPNGLVTSASSVAITGTAGDSNGIQTVAWQTNSQSSGVALGTSSWTVPAVPLYPGQNVLVIQAMNTLGVTRWVSLTITKQ